MTKKNSQPFPSFRIGLVTGFIAGIAACAGISYLYLLVSQDSIVVQGGTLNVNKPVVTNSKNQTASNRGVAADNGGTSVGGDNNSVQNGTQSQKGSTQPQQFSGSVQNITINNSQLPGYDDRLYSASASPPDISKYEEVSNLQPDSLIESASDKSKIRFDKKEIVLSGKSYTSFFNIDWHANESRFAFKLDGSQEALLLQFGLPDLPNGNTTNGAYSVKIYADGIIMWAGECRRSQGSQIISAPLNLANKKTLILEVTSNGSNESHLFFTKAKLLRKR
jgi:hypothetical protein